MSRIKRFEEFNESLQVERLNIDQDYLIVESITSAKDVVSKFKEMLRKGAVTAAIVSSLLAAQNVSAEQKSEIKKMATEEGIEVTKTLSTQVVKVTGYGKSMDQQTSKSMAITKARNEAAKQMSERFGDKEYRVTNIVIVNEKTQKNDDGSYYTAVQCTMDVTPQ